MLRWLLGLVAFLVLLAAGGVWWFLFRPLPQTTGALRVSGLKASVEVERDAVGIPHLRATSIEDLYLAQGYVVAQDRLWQLELLRRVARGEVAEFAGPPALQLDTDTRVLGLRAAAERAVSSLPDDQRKALEAYGRGVNAFIEGHRGNLPLEFRMLRLTPRPWTTADSLAIGLHMFRNLTTSWRDELMKMALVERAGPERVAEILPVRSDRDYPPGATATLKALLPSPVADFRTQIADYGMLSINLESDALPGSNNWVVTGAHSASGKAMLANDPHLEYSIPGIWYVMHLQAPGMNVAGVTLPGVPAVVIGHNERIAWGMTNVGADVQDLYREVLDPDNPRRYLVDGKWQDAQVRKEVIAVKGQRDQTVEVVETRHGPLIVNRPGERYALRWTALEQGRYRFPFMQINQAGNWEEFTAALRGFPGPAQNFVYADSSGNIGYYAAGLVPIRPKGDGNLPYDGNDTSSDWTGYIPFEQLPHVYNPPDGIIITANARISPDNYPYVMGTNWEAPERTERIHQLLDPAKKFTPEDFRRIQVDIYSGHHHRVAKAVAEAVRKVPEASPRLKQAADALGRWDGNARKEQFEPTLAHYARQQFLIRLLTPVLADRAELYRWRLSSVFLDGVLKDRPSKWLPLSAGSYDQLLAASLNDAMAVLEKRFATADMAQWRWGRQMTITFGHPIGGRLPVLNRYFNIGPFELSGTGYSVKQTTLTLGPSMRMVVDFADLNAATLTLPAGQSGHPFSSHYGDQFAKWMDGSGVPLSFTASDPARKKLVLQP